MFKETKKNWCLTYNLFLVYSMSSKKKDKSEKTKLRILDNQILKQK